MKMMKLLTKSLRSSTKSLLPTSLIQQLTKLKMKSAAMTKLLLKRAESPAQRQRLLTRIQLLGRTPPPTSRMPASTATESPRAAQ